MPTKYKFISPYSLKAAESIPPVFDLFPGFAGYSLRKLNTVYAGKPFRTRRSSDNTEMDIPFSGNYMNSGAYNTFVGAGTGFVPKWYDQGGTGYDVLQGTAANQPSVALGVINGKAVTRFSQAAVQSLGIIDMGISAAFSGTLADSSIFVVYRTTNQAQLFQTPFIMNNNGTAVPFTQTWFNPVSATGYSFGERTDGNVSNSIMATADFSSFCVVTSIYNTNFNIWKNSVAVAAPAARTNAALTVNRFQVGGGPPSLTLTGDIVEILIYDTDQTANRAAIESNIMAFYGI